MGMDLKASSFDFFLPEELIAQHPSDRRDQSRLLVYNRKTGEIHHRFFKDIPSYLRKDDCLVINDTRVIPARLFGLSTKNGKKIEFLLLREISRDCWEVLVKPGKRAGIGSSFLFADGSLKAEVLDITPTGERLVRFKYKGVFNEILDRVGVMPLPPYIREPLKDRERYQTVYARFDGSAAAPTAGLHFTNELLQRIESMGVSIARITLHVGLGTFRPVKSENIEEHKMHSEHYDVPMESAEKINKARHIGGRVIAVGTTSVRALESVALTDGRIVPGKGATDIFIYPGYKFKAVDAMITNFHLPRSTLIMLVSAFAGRKETLDIYKVAVENSYRFFSFGDAMLII